MCIRDSRSTGPGGGAGNAATDPCSGGGAGTGQGLSDADIHAHASTGIGQHHVKDRLFDTVSRGFVPSREALLERCRALAVDLGEPIAQPIAEQSVPPSKAWARPAFAGVPGMLRATGVAADVSARGRVAARLALAAGGVLHEEAAPQSDSELVVAKQVLRTPRWLQESGAGATS